MGGWREGRTTESSRSSRRGRWGLAPWRAQRSRFPSRAGAQTRTEPTDMGDMGPPLASPCAPHLLSRASWKHFVRTCHLYAQDPTRSEAHPPTELTTASSLVISDNYLGVHGGGGGFNLLSQSWIKASPNEGNEATGPVSPQRHWGVGQPWGFSPVTCLSGSRCPEGPRMGVSSAVFRACGREEWITPLSWDIWSVSLHLEKFW